MITKSISVFLKHPIHTEDKKIPQKASYKVSKRARLQIQRHSIFIVFFFKVNIDNYFNTSCQLTILKLIQNIWRANLTYA